MRFVLLIPMLTLGCKKMFIDVSGNVDGKSLNAQSAFWGGPYLIITDLEADCVDMAWVLPEYAEESTHNGVDTEESFHALQVTYESKVKDGKVNVSISDSPALAWFLIVEGGEAQAYQASSGHIELEIDKKERAAGDFSFDFRDDGSLKGEFRIENCNNLKSQP